MQHDPLVVSLKYPKKTEEHTSEAVPQPPVREKKPKKKSPLSMLVIVALVVLAAAGYYLYAYIIAPDIPGPVLDPKDVPAVINENDPQREVQELIEEVGRIIVLPNDEEPTVATVTDPEKLRDQVFFANAKAGDKVLIYTKARKAYLYDPIAGKLIEVAPITTQAE